MALGVGLVVGCDQGIYSGEGGVVWHNAIKVVFWGRGRGIPAEKHWMIRHNIKP